ncbi:CBS domain-containing protein [Streptomyces sp. NPDC004647]|uniref:CBS domain-containing protein n=1 Tax=Streptomyces sp. NPDC004647 TaxID=3154671 RepID=UPI0033A17381
MPTLTSASSSESGNAGPVKTGPRGQANAMTTITNDAVPVPTPQSRRKTIGPDGATVADAMRPSDLQITQDTIVDRALDILDAAEADYLLVHAGDGRCTGLVTRAHLAPYRARSWYTERTAIGAIVQNRGPFTRPGMTIATAAETMRTRALRAWPVVDDDGCILGVLTLERLRAAIAGPLTAAGTAP